MPGETPGIYDGRGGVRVTGTEIANSMQIQIAVNEAGQPVVMRVNEVGELTQEFGEDSQAPPLQGSVPLTELGIISPDSFQLRPGARAMVQAEYLAPSVADFTLPSEEQLTVGGMSKFETAGTVFADEELELETAMGSPSKTPVIKIDGEIVGNLKSESVAYLEDNQLLVEGQALDLTLTTVGKGYYQKIKAVASNGKTLELTNLSKSFQQPVLDKQVSAQVSFKTNRPQMQLYAYRQGKRVAIGEFNYGNQGSHRKSLDRLKAMGLDRQIFKAQVNSRLSVLTLKIDPESISYQDDPKSISFGLVKELMFAKLSQHPQIVDGIRSRGGYKWLYTCSHQLEGNEFWTGQGKDTPLVGIIAAGMKQTQLTQGKSQENSRKKLLL